MKKTVITLAVVAFAAAAVQATTTSANIVGYSKSTSSTLYAIAANQFSGNDNPSEVFGSSYPVGTKIYVFSGGSYSTTEYIDTFDENFNAVQAWSPDTLTVTPGTGYWVENNSGSEIEAILAGEVSSEASIETSLTTGLQLISYPYPVARTVSQMGFSPTVGDKIFVFNGSSYSTAEYIDTFDENFNAVQEWSPSTLSVGVGQGFWYEANADQTWTAVKPF